VLKDYGTHKIVDELNKNVLEISLDIQSHIDGLWDNKLRMATLRKL
jgi:hypothetical protein